MPTHRVGILTGGGDAPGLNAVIRAVVKYAVGQLHWQVVGIEDSFNGLVDAPRRIQDLTPKSCQGLLHRGGTILGTTNRGDPFAYPGPDGQRSDRSLELVRAVEDEGLEGIIVIGGDGTQAIAHRLMQTHGIPVVGVPKTIDNDLKATFQTFGFETAVVAATEALDRLHTTAEAHDRVMLLEVMGRDSGWIALYSGIAGGADGIAIPEIPYDPAVFQQKILERRRRGRQFTMLVVAEGAHPKTDGHAVEQTVQGRIVKPGAATTLAALLQEGLPDIETRVTVLGHLQRGGSPVAFDRILATRFGIHAVDLIREGQWGRMVALRENTVTSVPLEEATGAFRPVEPDHPLLDVARKTGITLGE